MREQEEARVCEKGETRGCVLYCMYPEKGKGSKPMDIYVMHQCSGHKGMQKTYALGKAMGRKLVGSEDLVKYCEACMMGKAKELPRFKKNRIRRGRYPGEILHVDTSGPWTVMSIHGKYYKFCVTDDYSGYIKDFYLRHKNEFVDCLKMAVAWFERQTGNKCRQVTCDNEFVVPNEVVEWWKPLQFIWKASAPGDKDGNPIAEKVNDITAGPARAMRYEAGLPPQFWAEMEHTATTLNNILPATTGPRKGISPFEQCLGYKPAIRQLKPIGCMGVMYVGKNVGKGNYRGKRVMLLGYDVFKELYRVWDGRKVIPNVRNVRFNPNIVGKEAHPPRVVEWDDETEGESIDKVQSDQPEHEPELEAQGEQVELVEPEPEHEVKDDTGPDFNIPFDSKSSQTEPLGDEVLPPVESFGTQDPSTNHPSRRYVEEKGPTKGLTWEQSDRVTTANIVRGKREVKERTSVTTVTEPVKPKVAPVVIPLSGVRVVVPAAAFGENWAKKEYGELWKDAKRTGTVLEPCEKSKRLKVRKQPKPSHHVSFDDGVNERMLDTEIRKYKVDTVLPPGELERAADDIINDEASELMLYLELKVPKAIVDEGLTAKDLKAGMDKEIEALKSFSTYTWVSPKEAAAKGVTKIVRLTWVHKVKLDEKGRKFVKSRLALRGDMLEAGVSYNPDQLFVPCAAHRSLLVIAKLAAWHGQKLYGIDFKNAYLNARMNDPVYAYAPDGLDREGHEGEILRIDGALYGAPQAGRRWYEILAPKLEELGFRMLDSDLCMFVEKDKPIRDAIIGVFHVDDLIFSAPNERAYNKFAGLLEKFYPLKRLGIAKEFKGMEIVQEGGSITLHQSKYQQQILKDVGYADARPLNTPSAEHEPEPMSEGSALRKHSIPSLVGKLLFLSKMTRPDIDQALNAASVMQTIDAGLTYAMLGRIFRYLVSSYRGIAFHGPRSSQEARSYPLITLWPDAAHKVCKKTGKSRTGYVVLWGGDPVAWLSKRQSRIALSSNDAEIFAAAECIREGLAVRHIMEELNIAQKGPLELFEDNAQTILAAERGMSGPRTKHLPLELHFIHHAQRDKEIKFVKVGTKKQIADVLTKHVPFDQFEYLVGKFMVKV